MYIWITSNDVIDMMEHLGWDGGGRGWGGWCLHGANIPERDELMKWDKIDEGRIMISNHFWYDNSKYIFHFSFFRLRFE